MMEKLSFRIYPRHNRISILKRHCLFFKKEICELGYDLASRKVFIASESMPREYKPVSEALISSNEFMEAIEGNAMDLLYALASIDSLLDYIKPKD